MKPLMTTPAALVTVSATLIGLSWAAVLVLVGNTLEYRDQQRRKKAV